MCPCAVDKLSTLPVDPRGGSQQFGCTPLSRSHRCYRIICCLQNIKHHELDFFYALTANECNVTASCMRPHSRARPWAWRLFVVVRSAALVRRTCSSLPLGHGVAGARVKEVLLLLQ